MLRILHGMVNLVKKHQKIVMGGVRFLIKKNNFSCYHIKGIDHKYEGILVYSFIE